MNSSASSQSAPGLLLIRACLPSGFGLQRTGDSLPSQSHIAVTAEMLRVRSVCIDKPDARSWRIYSGPVLPFDVHVEPDLTNTLAFLVTGVATGGCVTVPSWSGFTLQPGARLPDVTERVGCTTTRNREAVTLNDPGQLRGIDIDLHDASELTPVITALVALAEGTTWVTGVAHIRDHGTDRLSIPTAELRKLGVAVTEHHGDLEIMDGPRRRGGVGLSSYVDHHTIYFAVIVVLD